MFATRPSANDPCLFDDVARSLEIIIQTVLSCKLLARSGALLLPELTTLHIVCSLECAAPLVSCYRHVTCGHSHQ